MHTGSSTFIYDSDATLSSFQVANRGIEDLAFVTLPSGSGLIFLLETFLLLCSIRNFDSQENR